MLLPTFIQTTLNIFDLIIHIELLSNENLKHDYSLIVQCTRTRTAMTSLHKRFPVHQGWHQKFPDTGAKVPYRVAEILCSRGQALNFCKFAIFQLLFCKLQFCNLQLTKSVYGSVFDSVMDRMLWQLGCARGAV